MSSSSKKCCIIGGGGFIGARVTRLLCEVGREVVVVGRRGSPERSLPSGVTYISADYGDRAVLSDVLKGMAEVIDLAYSTVPQTSFADPIHDIVSNLPPTVGLLQEAVSAGLRKVVLMSSGGTVYGVTESIPVSEEHQTNPISPYGITKLAIEKYAGMYHHAYDLPVVVVRPGNAYGEDQQPNRGQGFIAAALHAVAQGKKITLYGREGTVRDYLHVDDVAKGVVAALEFGEAGHPYNLGSGIGRSNLDVLRSLEPLASRSDLEVRTEVQPPRRFDVPYNALNSEKLALVSEWRPTIRFEDGLAAVWEAALHRVRNSLG